MKTGRIRYLICVVALFLVFLLPFTIPANAQDKVIKWKAVDAWGSLVVLNEASFLYWIDAINKACKGRLEIDYRGGPENMHPAELLDYLQKGLIDVCDTSAVYYSTSVPEGEMIHFVAPESQDSWVRTSGFMDLYNEALIKRKGVRVLCLVGPRHDAALFSRKPITASNFGKAKLRVPGPLIGIFTSAMGGVPVTTSAGEIPEALKSGIVDGQIRPVEDVSTTKQYEYTPYALGPPFVSYTAEVFIGEKKWQELPDDLKKMVMDVSRKVEEYKYNAYVKIVQDHMKEMIQTKKAIKYHELSKEEFKAVPAAWKKSWDEWLAPKLLPGYAEKFQKLMKGHSVCDDFYPTVLKDLVNN